jgi:hypothetical protein
MDHDISRAVRRRYFSQLVQNDDLKGVPFEFDDIEWRTDVGDGSKPDIVEDDLPAAESAGLVVEDAIEPYRNTILEAELVADDPDVDVLAELQLADS